ncbi:MAG: CBS domain-containing protein [Arcobacteraceae bacterium]|nr:CBS domain-containing protein [Arcobacteraceae bacterium]
MFLKNFIQPIDDTVDKNAILQQVVDKMYQNKLHHIIIIENNKPIGIITERDIVHCFANHVDFSLLAIEYAMKDIIKLHSTRMIEYALSMMINNNIRKIVVVDSKNNYLGCIEQEDLIYRLEEALYDTHEKIYQLINQNNKAEIINENCTLEETLEMMSSKSLTSLLISVDNEPIGIISESDVIQLAQKNIAQNSLVKDFMHSPIIQINAQESIDTMIHAMKQNHIRRIVVYSSQDNSYHTLSSKDLANNVKGNYTKFLEAKLYDTRDTFNALSEYVIELIDMNDEQIIYWTNSITKANFEVNIDDEITKIIPQNIWSNLFKILINERIIYETVQIDERYYQIKGHYGTMSGENIIKLFLTDITDTTLLVKKLEKENNLKEKLLFDQAKMVQMGEMIANIAHQWRQPLSVITTSASGILFKQEVGILEAEDITKWMNQALDSANYLSETIDIFRNFLKEKKEYKEIILQERIENTFKILEASLKNNQIDLIDDIDYFNPITLTTVAGELEQVIINIVNNSKDVLLEQQRTDGWIKVHLTTLDNSALLTIEDNGGGISDDVMPHIFDEYFTTKNSDNGTGLGLYMSYRIITESLQGQIYAKNSENGAKFFIELPLNA